MDFSDCRNDSPKTAPPFPDLRVDGQRPSLWLLIPNGIVLAILGVELRHGPDTMIFALMGLIGVICAVLLSKFVRSPQMAITEGQFTYRYGFRAFRFPAADLADVQMQNRYVLLTLMDVQHVEPASMRERMRTSYQHRGFHFFISPGVYRLEQINALRAALGMPPQGSDPAGQQIEEFHQSIDDQRPLATQGLIAACVIVFVVKAISEHSIMGGTLPSNIAWGANYGPLTFGGQWWRLITHMFLHGGPVHIGMNMYVFWDVGRLMERLVGRAALLAIYLISGMIGGIASAAFHPEVVSVGASGAIFGVIGALFGLLLHDRQSVPPSRLKELRRAILIFVVLNIVFGLSIRGVDITAHLGGAVAGLLAGLIVVPVRTRGHWYRLAVLAIVGAAGIVLALHKIPRPFDFQAFARRHDQILREFDSLRSQNEEGTLSDGDFTEKVDTEVLVPWRELEKEMPAGKLGPLNDKQRARFVESIKRREESFVDLVAAKRTGNAVLAKRGLWEFNEAGQMEQDIFGAEDHAR